MDALAEWQAEQARARRMQPRQFWADLALTVGVLWLLGGGAILGWHGARLLASLWTGG